MLGKIMFHQVLRWHQKKNLKCVFMNRSSREFRRFIHSSPRFPRFSQIPGGYQTFLQHITRGDEARAKGELEMLQLESFLNVSFDSSTSDSVPREGAMDSDHSLHLPRLLSDSSVRHHVVGLRRSLLLDPRHSRFESWYVDGTRHLSHRHIRSDHATVGGREDHRGRGHAEGPRAVQWRSEALRDGHHNWSSNCLRHDGHVR